MKYIFGRLAQKEHWSLLKIKPRKVGREMRRLRNEIDYGVLSLDETENMILN